MYMIVLVKHVKLVVEHWLEEEIAQFVHHEESIQRPSAPGDTSHSPKKHKTLPWL